jgi:WS/DGAT C-terminal domain
VLADLPVHIADPSQRLAAVRTELEDLKASQEQIVGEALAALGGYSPYPLASWWVRLALGLSQREIVTVTTNMPGPGQPLYGWAADYWKSFPTYRSLPRSGPDLDLQLLRQRHLRDHRRLRGQPRP